MRAGLERVAAAGSRGLPCPGDGRVLQDLGVELWVSRSRGRPGPWLGEDHSRVFAYAKAHASLLYLLVGH